MKRFLKRVFVIILVILFMAAIGIFMLYNNGLSGLHDHTEPKAGQIKVACVGDSITYGHGISDWANNNYPAVLQGLLGNGYHVANFGESGRTLSPQGDQPYVQSEQYKLSLEYKPDVLVLMMGSNDSKPENWVSEEKFISDLCDIIDSYIEVNPDVKIFICTPARAFFADGITEGSTNYDIQPDIVEDISNSIKACALSGELKAEEIIDIHALTSEHREWFEKDNVHPSNEGAAAIAAAVAEYITK